MQGTVRGSRNASPWPGCVRSGHQHRDETQRGDAGQHHHRLEELHTTRYIREVEAADIDARGRLDLLMELVLADDEPANVEVAIRAWALDDPIAAAAKERVDRSRLAFLRKLLAECGYDEADTEQIAQILYLLVLGSGNMLPGVTPEQLRALCRRVLS